MSGTTSKVTSCWTTYPRHVTSRRVSGPPAFYVDVVNTSLTGGLYPTGVRCTWAFGDGVSGEVSDAAAELHAGGRHTVEHVYPTSLVSW